MKQAFSLTDIKMAQSKVKSGADFPTYIQQIKTLGVSHYDSFVEDGHTDYYDAEGEKRSSLPLYASLNISNQADREQFIASLKAHQAGKTDYQGFCADCANAGVHRWQVSIGDMTCTYFDQKQNIVYQQQIPG